LDADGERVVITVETIAEMVVVVEQWFRSTRGEVLVKVRISEDF